MRSTPAVCQHGTIGDIGQGIHLDITLYSTTCTCTGRRYNKIITEKNLDLNYESFIVESFGAFATDTWKFINTVCDPNTHPNANDEYNPWNNPAPLRAFTLAASFANQRGNAVMLLEANSRRRLQRVNHRHASG